MSDAGDTYFQFPLCALAFCTTETERLDCIISFGVSEAGRTMLAKLDQRTRLLKAAELSDFEDTPSDYRKANTDHIAVMLGAQAIGVRLGSVASCLERWRKLSEFRNLVQAKHGADPEVRVRKNLTFETRDKDGIVYREFAVLCAVYSCIGAKNYPVRITRQTIQCRMLGYKSPSIMEQELASRAESLKPITLRQINYTLDRLDERQFFARARANERQTFYSNRIPQDQLELRLVEGKSYSASFHERRVQRGAELIARVKAKRAALKSNTY